MKTGEKKARAPNSGGAQRENGFDAHIVQEYAGNGRELQRLVHDPERWYMEYDRSLSARQTGSGDRYAGVPFTFTLSAGEFFAMGDNSPRSKDSRLWSNVRGDQHRHAVPRDALVGKAFFIYWPHGIPFLNDGKGYALMNHKTISFENRHPVVRRTDYRTIELDRGRIVFDSAQSRPPIAGLS